MSENGPVRPLDIDVTDEHAFKSGVVQHLQFIADRTACLPELKRKVDHHEAIVNVGKYAAIPVLGFLQLSIGHLLKKIGW